MCYLVDQYVCFWFALQDFVLYLHEIGVVHFEGHEYSLLFLVAHLMQYQRARQQAQAQAGIAALEDQLHYFSLDFESEQKSPIFGQFK